MYAAMCAALTDAAVVAMLSVLEWCARTGAALASITANGRAGVALLAPIGAGAPRALMVPDAVDATLVAEWRTVRAALETAHARLGPGGCPGWPNVSAPLVTVAAWAYAERAAFDAGASDAYEERAAVYEYDAGCSRWFAELRAVEDVTRGRRPAYSTHAKSPVQCAVETPAIHTRFRLIPSESVSRTVR